MLHVNIRSLQKNFESFLDFLQTFKTLPDLICVSETKLKSLRLRNLSIPNYEIYFSNSHTNAGGVAIYISKHFTVHNTSKQLIGVTHVKTYGWNFGIVPIILNIWLDLYTDIPQVIVLIS